MNRKPQILLFEDLIENSQTQNQAIRQKKTRKKNFSHQNDDNNDYINYEISK